MEDFPAPSQGFLVTHFLVVSDQERVRMGVPPLSAARERANRLNAE